MKKLTLYIILMLSATSFAQSFFDKYEDMDDVTSVVVTDEMFKMIGSIEPEGQQAKEEVGVLKQLTGLKVFSTENAQIASRMLNEAKSFVNQKSMKELMRINDNDANVKFYVVKGNQPYIAKELVMLLTGKHADKQTVVMSLTGDIDLRKLSKLNSKIKVVDKKYLEDVEKKMEGNN